MNQLYKILSTAIFLLVFFFVPNNIAAQSEYLIDTKEEFENAIIQTGLDTNSNPGNIQLNSFVPTSAPAIDNRNVAVLVYNDSAIDSDLLFLLNSYFKAFVYQSGSVDDDVYNFSSINELSQLSKYQILIVYCANTSEAKEAPQSIIDAFADSGRIVIEGLLTYGVQRQLEIQTSEVNYKLPLTNARDIAYDGEFIWTMDEILVDKILKISPLNGSIIDSYCAPSTVPRGMVF